MALGDSIFRSRAASLLRPSTPSTSLSIGQGVNHEKGFKTFTEPAFNEKQAAETGQNDVENSQTLSSSNKTYHSPGQNAVAHNREAQRIVRTIPGELACNPLHQKFVADVVVGRTHTYSDLKSSLGTYPR